MSIDYARRTWGRAYKAARTAAKDGYGDTFAYAMSEAAYSAKYYGRPNGVDVDTLALVAAHAATDPYRKATAVPVAKGPMAQMAIGRVRLNELLRMAAVEAISSDENRLYRDKPYYGEPPELRWDGQEWREADKYYAAPDDDESDDEEDDDDDDDERCERCGSSYDVGYDGLCAECRAEDESESDEDEDEEDDDEVVSDFPDNE